MVSCTRQAIALSSKPLCESGSGVGVVECVVGRTRRVQCEMKVYQVSPSEKEWNVDRNSGETLLVGGEGAITRGLVDDAGCRGYVIGPLACGSSRVKE